MKNHPYKTLLGCLSLAAMLAVSAGCASKSYDKGTATANALQASADAVAQTSGRVNDVLATMNNLTFNPSGDLRTSYDNFTGAAGKLNKATDKLDATVQDMQVKATAYLQNWSNQLATIQSNDIRTRSADRRDQVSAKLDTVTASYQSVKSAIAPFTSDVRDIQTYLGTDLTLGGIDSIKSVVAKTKVDAVPLRDSIKKLQNSFDDLGTTLSPVLPPPDK